MKTIKTLIIAFLIIAITPATAQTADEIINTYFENTGGLANWEKLESLKFNGSVDLGGMVLPFEVYSTKSGYTLTKADLQGQTFYQDVFDGETLWASNQMTMAAEKSDSESTENYKNEMNDFPDPFINYKEKGYTVELIGNEIVEGTDTFKIKLVKEPITVDGNKVEDVSYYYFDTENFVPIVMEEELTSGPGKGMVMQTKFSDYEEVNGLYFPFSSNIGVVGQPGGTTITITEITFNPEIDMAMFAFPEVATPTEEGKK